MFLFIILVLRMTRVVRKDLAYYFEGYKLCFRNLKLLTGLFLPQPKMIFYLPKQIQSAVTYRLHLSVCVNIRINLKITNPQTMIIPFHPKKNNRQSYPVKYESIFFPKSARRTWKSHDSLPLKLNFHSQIWLSKRSIQNA